MMAPPAWLPKAVSVDGEYHEVVARLYKIFETDFKVARPRLGPLLVWWDKQILPGEQYEEGFWHLTQVTQFEKFRPGFRPGIPRGGPAARGGRRKVDVVTTYPID